MNIGRLALLIARLFLALVAGFAVGGPFLSVGGWPAMWLVWGLIVGLVLARWWALGLAALAFLVTFGFNYAFSTRAEGDTNYPWAMLGFSLLSTVIALAGITAGILVFIAGRHLTRRLLQARS